MSMMYSLTAMTGREASANRTVVIGTVEFNWRVWMILLFTAPVALVATVFAWAFVGQVAIAVFPLVEIAAVFLIHRRQSSGLRLRTYQAVLDQKRGLWDKAAAVDTFLLCMKKIEVGESDYRYLMSNTAPYVPPAPAPADALVDTLREQPVPAGVTPVALRDLPHVEATPVPAPVAPPTPEPTPTPPTPGPTPLDRDLIGREHDDTAVDLDDIFDPTGNEGR